MIKNPYLKNILRFHLVVIIVIICVSIFIWVKGTYSLRNMVIFVLIILIPIDLIFAIYPISKRYYAYIDDKKAKKIDSSKYHLTRTDVFYIFLMFGFAFVLLTLVNGDTSLSFALLTLSLVFAGMVTGILILIYSAIRFAYRSFNKFCNYICENIQKENEKKRAIEIEKGRVLNKIGKFIENLEREQDKPSGEAEHSGTIWEGRPLECEDLSTEFDHILKESHQDKASKKDNSNSSYNSEIPKGETSAGICPVCGSPLVWRRAKRTGELYRGCTNYNGGCRYNDRSY